MAFEPASNKMFEAVIDLTQKRIWSWKEVPGVQPALLIEELLTIVPELVRADPGR